MKNNLKQLVEKAGYDNPLDFGLKIFPEMESETSKQRDVIRTKTTRLYAADNIKIDIVHRCMVILNCSFNDIFKP